MSTLTDQIKAKCATIAENQKKVYDKGFEDGKASVKHIQFFIYHEWDYIDCCAFAGMTWREWVNKRFDPSFSIEGGKVKYNDGYQLYTVADVSPDDVIVVHGYYETLPPPEEWSLYYNGKTVTLYREPETGVRNFVDGEHNTLGFTIDDDGYLRTPTGEFVYRWQQGDEKYYIEPYATPMNTDSYDEFYYYTEFVAEPWTDGRVSIHIADYDWDLEFRFIQGMTWQELAASNFSDSLYASESTVTHGYGYFDALYLDGVKVKGTDIVRDDVSYEGRSE